MMHLYADMPNQPRGLNYPFREFEIVRRCFQNQWQLDYDGNKNLDFPVFATADRNQQLNVPFKEPTFIKSSFSNWKDALSKFRTYERST